MNTIQLSNKLKLVGEIVLNFNNFGVICKDKEEDVYKLIRLDDSGKIIDEKYKRFRKFKINKHFLFTWQEMEGDKVLFPGRSLYVSYLNDSLIKQEDMIKIAYFNGEDSIESRDISGDSKVILLSVNDIQYALNYKGEVIRLSEYRNRIKKMGGAYGIFYDKHTDRYNIGYGVRSMTVEAEESQNGLYINKSQSVIHKLEEIFINTDAEFKNTIYY